MRRDRHGASDVETVSGRPAAVGCTVARVRILVDEEQLFRRPRWIRDTAGDTNLHGLAGSDKEDRVVWHIPTAKRDCRSSDRKLQSSPRRCSRV